MNCMTKIFRSQKRSKKILALISTAFLMILFCTEIKSTGGNRIQQEKIAPGLAYFRYQAFENGRNIVVHVLRASIREKSIMIRSLKADGKETVRTMVNRLNNSGERVLGAINGDFFLRNTDAGVPNGVQVSDGKLIFGPANRSMIGFDKNNKPYIDIVKFKGEIEIDVKKSGFKPMKINAVNVFPKEFKSRDGILVYTPAFLALQPTRYLGLVVSIEKITPALQVGDECEGRIAEVSLKSEGMNIPQDGCLVYFLGKYAYQLNRKLSPGMPIKLRLSLPPIKGGVPQAIGGGPRILRSGKVSVEFTKEDFLRGDALYLNRKRHPRSAVGYDKSKKFLFLVTVEGRQRSGNIYGMTMQELGLFMKKKLRCYDAMGFDGGGSAAMYVVDRDIVSNSGEERRIANSLLISVKRESPSY